MPARRTSSPLQASRGPGSRRVASAVVVLGVVAAMALAGCGSSKDSTPHVATVTPAKPSAAPAGPAHPAGITVPTPAGTSSPVLSGAALGMLAPGGTAILRLDTRAPQTPPTAIPTPRLVSLAAADGGFVGAGPQQLVRVDAGGQVRQAHMASTDPTVVATTTSGQTLVGTASGHVLVFASDLHQIRDIGGFVRVDAITVSPTGQVVVLDRAQSSVTPVDIDSGSLGPALRAGNGAAKATVDETGRISVTDPRDDQILGFYGDPLVMRFRYPVAAGPYAVDYDDVHRLLWVTVTGADEVIAYDLASGEPVERHRFGTVAQPDSLVVDGTTGTVYILSARDGGLQIVSPPYPTSATPPTNTPGGPR